MAEGSVRASSGGVVCRFFANGVCREGTRCKFSHDRTSSTQSLDTVCRYYLQGRCLYGDRCRFDHIAPNRGGANHNRNYDSSNRSSNSNLSSGSSQSSSPRLNTPPDSYSNVKTFLHVNAGASGAHTGRMTVLKGNSSDSGIGEESSHTSSNTGPGSPDWVNAPEFIPKTALKSYADILKPDVSSNSEQLPAQQLQSQTDAILCPYAMLGDCPYGDQCAYLHGDVCELCGRQCLHPFDEEQRKQHNEECEHELERDMELSFAIQRSVGKSCGICMDVILEKQPPSERRFGILEKCSHVFCLSCIRQWRKTKQFESRHISTLDPLVIRACPECRVVSDFVTPSRYWVETKEEKEKLITDYKKALSTKPCKYFKQGRGECQFAGACFYLHAYPDGTKAELPPPQPRRRRNQDGELEAMDRIFLWDFFELRDDHILFQLELDEMLDLFSDTDDESDWSDFDLLMD